VGQVCDEQIVRMVAYTVVGVVLVIRNCVCLDEDYSTQDQVKVFSHEGDGENTEHLNSMDLHDIKTELERDAEAEKAEVRSRVV
jgi:N-acetylglutamate synthase/N-acetylornithine aminotransferase